jgi:WD40 repeat protein
MKTSITWPRRLVYLAASCAALLASVPAAAQTTVSFHKQIRPILQQRCQGCHQPAKARGKLLLTGFDGFAKGGIAGPSFLAGKPEQSIVIKHLKGIDDHAIMPEGEQPLTPEQIALFERWIKEGARDDTPEEFKRTLASSGPPTYRKPVSVTAMASSPDGTALAVAGYREVLLHKPDGSEIIGRLVGLSERIESLVFSPSGDLLLVAGGSAGRFGEIQLWDWRKQQLIRSIMPSFDTVYGASFSADGKLIALGCADNSARILETATGKQVRRLDHHLDWIFGTAFSTNGKSVITASRDRTVKLCEVDSGALIGNLTTLDPTQPASELRHLVRRPGSDQLLGGGEDGVPRLFQAEVKGGAGGNLIRAYGKLPGRIEAAAFSLDGKLLAVGGGGGAVGVHNTDNGQAVASLTMPCTVFALAFSADGKTLAAAGLDGLVRLYSLPDGKPVKEFVPVPITAKP